MIKKVQEIIATMIAASPDIEAAALVTIDDGLSIAGKGVEGTLDMAAAAAYLASLVKSNDRAIMLLGSDEKLDDILVSTNEHHFVVRRLPSQPFFVFAMTDRESWLGKTRLQVQRCTEQIAQYEDFLRNQL